MIPIVVVENPKRWPLDLKGVEVVPAREYLVERKWAELRGAAVYNLCRQYGYQTLGYYVSLLATARGHRPLPSVSTLQTLSLLPVVRSVSEELDDLIQKSLSTLRADEFRLSIYFGKNVARRHDTLSRALFNQFPSPFLLARFVREHGSWRLAGLRPIPTTEIPESHRPFAVDQAQAYFARPLRQKRKTSQAYDLAILWNPDDAHSPSNEGAIRKFIRAAADEGMEAEIITQDEYGRLAEYDALFIRDTTRVDHYTFRFARRAVAEGLVVVDDPESIIRCTNKVFQAEAFQRRGIPAPRTLVVHEGNVDQVVATVGLPCVLKRPDGAFSQGVVKVESETHLAEILPALFAESDLLVAQEWTPSAFDWRVGILGGEPLFAARYHMARGHWQIIRASDTEKEDTRYGKVEAVPLDAVPPRVMDVALEAAALMGDGLYGVDLKEVEGQVVVMEVNDNPNVDAGMEDTILKDELYRRIMGWFRQRLDLRGAAAAGRRRAT